jgi:uncharacterized protein YecE (DUF72 family)
MKKKVQIRTGCSGYYNRHWKEVFYPGKLPQRKWFEFYCEQFNSVELNSTFYKFPTAESLYKWYEQAPNHFLFSVKAPKLITHFKRFNNCEQQLEDLYTACEKGLAGKLGCVLFQLPPGIQYDEEKLDLVIKSLRPAFNNVVEFRHKSWWSKKVYQRLAEHNISFCSISHPSLPATIVANTSTVYVRMHGVPKMFYSGYGPKQLQQLHDDILKKRGVRQAFVYFNNTAGVEGVLNAQEFHRLS